jgi:hypothetical protein
MHNHLLIRTMQGKLKTQFGLELWEQDGTEEKKGVHGFASEQNIGED